MTATSYTVHRNGEVIAEGLSLSEAAIEILRFDGHDFEVRPLDGGGYGLFVSRGSRNAPGGLGEFVHAWRGDRLIMSLAATEADAWQELAEQIVLTAWPGHPEAVTDEDRAAENTSRGDEDAVTPATDIP